jgi:hypothetical protein
VDAIVFLLVRLLLDRKQSLAKVTLGAIARHLRCELSQRVLGWMLRSVLLLDVEKSRPFSRALADKQADD